jgi:hypothetical protein
MDRESIITQLVATRSAIGTASWLAPRVTGKLFGLDVAGNPQAPYLARLFGVRDVALGYGLATSDGAQRDAWLRIGIACDLADAAAGLAAGRRGELPSFATALVTGTALFAAGLGAKALSTAG